jgi:hypothetical protein
MMPESAEAEWIRNGWNIASRLLATVEPDAVGSVSNTPTLVWDDKFILYYALDLSPDRRREFWIITGEFPPAIVDASGTSDERDAVRLFGELFHREGCHIKAGRLNELSFPDFVLGQYKHDPKYGEFLEGIGSYLRNLADTFPWEQYGISGKVFS